MRKGNVRSMGEAAVLFLELNKERAKEEAKQKESHASKEASEHHSGEQELSK
jgi:hypothetical protein